MPQLCIYGIIAAECGINTLMLDKMLLKNASVLVVDDDPDVLTAVRLLLKTEAKEVKVQTASLMPSYASALSAKEMDDLVAYLNSLRGKP